MAFLSHALPAKLSVLLTSLGYGFLFFHLASMQWKGNKGMLITINIHTIFFYQYRFELRNVNDAREASLISIDGG
jgi:hypothetical protein